jgi:hypothetical protein
MTGKPPLVRKSGSDPPGGRLNVEKFSHQMKSSKNARLIQTSPGDGNDVPNRWKITRKLKFASKMKT